MSQEHYVKSEHRADCNHHHHHPPAHSRSGPTRWLGATGTLLLHRHLLLLIIIHLLLRPSVLLGSDGRGASPSASFSELNLHTLISPAPLGGKKNVSLFLFIFSSSSLSFFGMCAFPSAPAVHAVRVVRLQTHLHPLPPVFINPHILEAI